MKPGIQKILEIIYDLISIGKTTAKDIQVSTDVTTARRIKRAAAEGDLKKLKTIVTKGHILIDEDDITEVISNPGGPLTIGVSVDFIVKYRQVFKDLRRCRRARGG